MKNLSRNTAAVLVITLFTGLAVFSAIQLGGRLFGTSTASAQTLTSQAVTGQLEDSSDGVESVDEYYYDDGSGGYGNGYGGSSSADSGSASTTQTCPATGCSATSCHATQ
ncbi:MAG TPA: hypothetical protein VFZ86_10715 [Thermoleophilia bacterium]|nr:hypothetical protein [Thermoleophilia bacterium]